MAVDDGATVAQLGTICGLARRAVPDFDIDTLDMLVKPVYGCGTYELNRGQASMLIDDLKYECGEGAKPDYASIFDPRPAAWAPAPPAEVWPTPGEEYPF